MRMCYTDRRLGKSSVLKVVVKMIVILASVTEPIYRFWPI